MGRRFSKWVFIVGQSPPSSPFHTQFLMFVQLATQVRSVSSKNVVKMLEDISRLRRDAEKAQDTCSKCRKEASCMPRDTPVSRPTSSAPLTPTPTPTDPRAARTPQWPSTQKERPTVPSLQMPSTPISPIRPSRIVSKPIRPFPTGKDNTPLQSPQVEHNQASPFDSLPQSTPFPSATEHIPSANQPIPIHTRNNLVVTTSHGKLSQPRDGVPPLETLHELMKAFDLLEQLSATNTALIGSPVPTKRLKMNPGNVRDGVGAAQMVSEQSPQDGM